MDRAQRNHSSSGAQGAVLGQVASMALTQPTHFTDENAATHESSMNYP